VPAREKAALMRSVNAGIAFFAADSEPGRPGVPDRWSFVCECGAPDCCEWVELDLAAYADIRAQADAGILADGHSLASGEAVGRETAGMNAV
jgi:hypothetical protein